MAGKDSEAVARALVDDACFVSNGDFYATTVTDRLGVTREGLVRLGLACYSTEEEVARVLAGIARIRG
jgi:selenocysteine lyase/cysteine desulfurase